LQIQPDDVEENENDEERKVGNDVTKQKE